jgi:hypothetical protein
MTRTRHNPGFKEEWKKKLDEAHAEYKESVKAKPKISKNPGAATGLSMEELIRQQKEMLAEVCASVRMRQCMCAAELSVCAGGSVRRA